MSNIKDDSILNTLFRGIVQEKEKKKEKDKQKEEYVEEKFIDYNKKTIKRDERIKLYSHIIKLEIYIYYINTDWGKSCGFCERFLNDKLQIDMLKRLDYLTGINKSNISVKFIGCDWNCIKKPSSYVDKNGKLKTYVEFDQYGENYLVVFGRGIEYFPTLEVVVYSKNYKEGKVPFHKIFRAIGSIVEKDWIFKFLNQEYKIKMKKQTVNLLKPLLNFLRDLDDKNAGFSVHDKYSDMLGQYHRFI